MNEWMSLKVSKNLSLKYLLKNFDFQNWPCFANTHLRILFDLVRLVLHQINRFFNNRDLTAIHNLMFYLKTKMLIFRQTLNSFSQMQFIDCMKLEYKHRHKHYLCISRCPSLQSMSVHMLLLWCNGPNIPYSVKIRHYYILCTDFQLYKRAKNLRLHILSTKTHFFFVH